jgi:hypothetical protein
MARAMRSADGDDGAFAAVERPLCGIVMPVSSIDGCSEAHWAAVRDIVRAAVESAGFEATLVPTADDTGAMEERILRNRQDDSIAVCDVSGKDPRVMFELGLRLALDKPTIIIKDDVTSYLFDVNAIEYLEYPRDLHKSKMADFRENLTYSIRSIYNKAALDQNCTTALKRFVEAKSAHQKAGRR